MSHGLVPGASTPLQGGNGSQWVAGFATELMTLATGATTTDSAANLLPANSVIDCVSIRVTTTITTAASFSVGDATTAARFLATGTALTAGTTANGLAALGANQAQAAAAKLRITTNVNPGAGQIRVVVYYRTFTAPTA